MKKQSIRTKSAKFDVLLATRQHIASWLLLVSFVPMLLLSSLHIHKEGTAAAMAQCIDCVQHSCHGHLTQTALWTHDCVLCQFLTLSFIAVCTVSLIIIHKVVSVSNDAQQRNICVAHIGIVGLRAPPVFSIL